MNYQTASCNGVTLRYADPDMFRALGLLSVPFRTRSVESISPRDVMQQYVPEGKQLYTQAFQVPGRAEAELEADVASSIRKIIYTASGDSYPEQTWQTFRRQ